MDDHAVEPRRSPYAHDELARLIAPRSIAIIGASERRGSFGNRAMENLAAFDGPVHLVNARATQLAGRPCYPNVAELPDCAFLAVPREAVEGVVTDCAKAGVGGVIVVASGLAETGKPERIAEQTRITALARTAGMRLVGPNTIGLVNYAIGAGMTFSAMPERRPLAPHAVGIVSQSGSLGFSLVQAVERGLSVSHVLTAGNSADVDVADHVAYLAADPSCRAIACVFEGMADPGRMIRAAEIAWAADKPLVMYKMATGEEGARAAMSHTGSLAGSNEAYAAAFARCGVIQVDRLEAVMETAAFFAKAPRPKARGVAVIATSGGATIMAADKAELHGVPLPQPGPEAAGLLAANVPDFGSPRNPCDVTAQLLNDLPALEACTDALMADEAFGALVTSHAYAYESATSRLPFFDRAAARSKKIACNVWAPAWLGGPGARETEESPHLALFHGMDDCFAALAAWHRRDALRRAPSLDPAARLTSLDLTCKLRRLLDAAPALALTESESKRALALYGIPVVTDRVVQDAQAATKAAEALGFPVVLKIESPDILHKSDAGVVRLGLRTREEVHEAAEAILAAARAIEPAPRIAGISVQPMLPKGVEVMVGGRHDPQFGPLIVVGLGGIFVELLKDAALAPAPVSPDEARAMLESLKGVPLLRGFRGGEAVDLDRLADIVARASELIADADGAIAEMDVNPLICAGASIAAVDGLIVKRSEADR